MRSPVACVDAAASRRHEGAFRATDGCAVHRGDARFDARMHRVDHLRVSPPGSAVFATRGPRGWRCRTAARARCCPGRESAVRHARPSGARRADACSATTCGVLIPADSTSRPSCLLRARYFACAAPARRCRHGPAPAAADAAHGPARTRSRPRCGPTSSRQLRAACRGHQVRRRQRWPHLSRLRGRRSAVARAASCGHAVDLPTGL